MKKTFTLLMALALVTSMLAMPLNPKQFILGKQKTQTEQKLNQRVPAKKNIARHAKRNAAMEEGTTTTYTFSSFTSSDKVELTASNFNITLTKGTQNQPAYTSNQARIYPGGTLVISSTNNITKIEYNYVVNANKSSKVPTIDGATGSKAAGTWTESTKTWIGSDTKVTFAISGEAGNVGFTSVTVTTDGQGGGGGEEGDTIQITGINYGDAYYYTYSGDNYWDIDLYNDYDEDEEAYVYPEFYVTIAADSKTAIAGDCDLYYAGLWTSENDSVEMADGTLTISYDKTEGTYSFKGEFNDEKGNVYVLNVASVDVLAYDADNDYEEIELDEEGGGGESQYSFDFTKGQQNWTINDVDLPTDLSEVWKQSSSYGMRGSAYYQQAYAAESWLISPNIDLSSFTEATLKVKQAINKGANTNLSAKISTDGGSNWTDLALNLPEGTSWDFQTDKVSLDAYVGDTVQIAFAYISTTEICPTWEIMTVDITTGGEGGDTTKIENVDGLEIDYYPSYSEEGAYDYTFLLYNSEDEDYIPMIAFDILTATEKSYAGTYTMQGGTLTDYSYYVYGTGDDDYMEFTDGEITITDNGNGNYTIKGWFTDGTKVYLVDKTLDGEYFNTEYPYEPETKTTLNLTITSGEEDDSYASDYGIMDLYLTTADGELTLEYVMQSTETSTTIPDGTYPIEASEYDEDYYVVDKGYSYFEAGYYISSYGIAAGSTYQTEEEIYYLVSGTVKVETVEGGKKVTLTGTTYYGSTIKAEYIISGSTALREAAVNMKMDGKYLMNGQFVILKNNVPYNAQGQVIK